MKRFASVLLVLAVPLVSSGCSEARSGASPDEAHVREIAAAGEAPAGTLQSIALRVPDMACAMCARPIEKNLRAMGVRDVEADLESKWVTGRFNPERLTPEAIRGRVERLNFRVTEVRVG